MRTSHVILATALFWGFAAAEAAGMPLMCGHSVFALQSNTDIETVRWRRRYRQESWTDRRAESGGRDDTDALGSSGANRLSAPEIVRPDPRRRRGWIDPPPAQ
jgi:hypothetical protein